MNLPRGEAGRRTGAMEPRRGLRAVPESRTTPAPDAPQMHVEALRDPAGVAQLAAQWEALADRVSAEPFHRPGFVRNWIDNFAPNDPLEVLLARDEDGTLRGVLPLVRLRRRLGGVPLRILHAAANAHACRFDLLAEPGFPVAQALLAHLLADGSWDALHLRDVPEGGAAWQLARAAEAVGLRVGTRESLRSPWFSLADSSSLGSARFRANLRRRRRKLESQGEVLFERFQAGPALEHRLAEGFELERAGWKGRSGTAIAQEASTRGFYRELAHAAAARVELSLAFLRLDGRPVAFQYALERDGTLFLLKPAYDESLADCSPGQLLVDEVRRDAARRGLRRFDFLGSSMHWKQDWTDRVRVHTCLTVLRDSLPARVAHALAFVWRPRVKEWTARWRR